MDRWEAALELPDRVLFCSEMVFILVLVCIVITLWKRRINGARNKDDLENASIHAALIAFIFATFALFDMYGFSAKFFVAEGSALLVGLLVALLLAFKQIVLSTLKEHYWARFSCRCC